MSEPKRPRPHVRLFSDGTPTGTHVYVDGQLLPATAVEFSVSARPHAFATVTVTMYVREIEIEGEMDVVRRPPIAPTGTSGDPA